MAFYVIQRIHRVWKSAEIGQMMAESIPISDMESLTGCPVQLPTHGWKPLSLADMPPTMRCLEKGLYPHFQFCFPEASTHYSSCWKLSEQIHGSSISPGVGEDDGARSGQGQICLERQAVMWAYVFVPTVQGMCISSLINCFKISSLLTVSLCQALHQFTAAVSWIPLLFLKHLIFLSLSPLGARSLCCLNTPLLTIVNSVFAWNPRNLRRWASPVGLGPSTLQLRHTMC